MNGKFIIALMLVSVMSLTGCASVQKKFTRKKPEKRRTAAVYLQEGPYQKEFTNDYYYKTHFTQWSTWHDELLLQFGANRKKMRRCAQEAVGHLSDLSLYLNESKRAELEPLLNDLKQIVRRIESGTVSDAEESGMKTELEKIKRLVSSGYYYDKVKDSVLPDTVDLGSGNASGT